ncbi:MAG: hypothetical protein LQ343_005039 [Gyalolechia ehrenbergii]|nr:MAG: hypothetical protein LQ343_005039 [Gyalolechia ehrenbergii]
MGRPRKRPRENDRSEYEHIPPAKINGLLDPDHAAPAGSDTEGTLGLHSTVHSEAVDTSVSIMDYAHSVEPNTDLPAAWDNVQTPDLSVFPFAGTRQRNNFVNGGESEDTATDHDTGDLASMQIVDLVGISCSCLNELYSMLASFQSLPPSSFPASRGPLLEATNLARRVVRCPYCPRDYPSALQNLMLLTTLLPLVTHGYAKLLEHIQERAAQGCTITYRVGDPSLSAAHLHTGTPDCPMGFNVELNAEEWAVMTRKVVRQDVYGNSQRLECVLSVVEELEQRQCIWHLLQPFCTDASLAPRCSQRSEPCQHGLCMQLTGAVRKAIEALNL